MNIIFKLGAFSTSSHSFSCTPALMQRPNVFHDKFLNGRHLAFLHDKRVVRISSGETTPKLSPDAHKAKREQFITYLVVRCRKSTGNRYEIEPNKLKNISKILRVICLFLSEPEAGNTDERPR